MFSQDISDIDLSGSIPRQIELDLTNPTDPDLDISRLDSDTKFAIGFAYFISKNSDRFIKALRDGRDETLTPSEFTDYVRTQLANPEIISNPRHTELYTIWDEVIEYDYAKEDAIIAELQQKNMQKFEALKSILRYEQEYMQHQKHMIKNIQTQDYSLSSGESSRFDDYNTALERYNIASIDAATRLLSGERSYEDPLEVDLISRQKRLMDSLR